MDGVEVNGYTIEPGANLWRANLEDADLSGASLTGANLKWATEDENTAWPEGFDQRVAGVVFED